MAKMRDKTEKEKWLFDLPYTVDPEGSIRSYNEYNNKSGEPRLMKPWQNKGGYWYIDLGENFRSGVHQLVAEAFLEKPKDLINPVVHHKDGNTNNNSVDNLEWVSQRVNVHKSYDKLSQVRNFKLCSLYYKDEHVYNGKSVIDACRYANKHYGTSISSLQKYKVSGDCRIELEDVTTIRKE